MPIPPGQVQDPTTSVVEEYNEQQQQHVGGAGPIREVLTEQTILVMNNEQLVNFNAFIWSASFPTHQFAPVRIVVERPEWVPNIAARYSQMYRGGWRACDSCGIDHLRVTFGAQDSGGANVCGLCLVVLQQRDARAHQDDLCPSTTFHAAPARRPLPLHGAVFCADASADTPVCETCGVRGIRSFFRSGARAQCPFCYTFGAHGGIFHKTEQLRSWRSTLIGVLRQQPLSAQLIYDILNGHTPTLQQLEASDEEARAGEIRAQREVEELTDVERALYNEIVMGADLRE